MGRPILKLLLFTALGAGVLALLGTGPAPGAPARPESPKTPSPDCLSPFMKVLTAHPEEIARFP
jgi:hypothetical protein